MKNTLNISDFYCTKCGNKGIPIPRKKGQERGSGHLKVIFCLTCQQETNHCEIVRENGNDYNKDTFLKEFELGRFVNGQRVPNKDLMRCSKDTCKYNQNLFCWNVDKSYNCPHRP
jgi:hypothetical protein